MNAACRECNGTGTCPYCRGTGHLLSGRTCPICNGKAQCRRCSHSCEAGVPWSREGSDWSTVLVPEARAGVPEPPSAPRGRRRLPRWHCLFCNARGSCPACEGRGSRRAGDHCSTCNGSGRCLHCQGLGVMALPSDAWPANALESGAAGPMV